MHIGTLDGRYGEALADFARRRDRLRAAGGPGAEAALRALDEEEIAYVVSAVPFIREYTAPDEARSPTAAPTRGVGALDGFVEVKHTSKRHNVLQRYLMHVEKRVDNATVAAAANEAPRERSEYSCPECDAPMIFHARESALVCTACGVCTAYSEMSAANLTYEQEIHQDVVTHFAYKRLNHFCEWLNSLQAKENTEIPQDVVDAVKSEFKKVRATTRAEIKPTKVREFLKKLKLNK